VPLTKSCLPNTFSEHPQALSMVLSIECNGN
jgi:hypothetical protein